MLLPQLCIGKKGQLYHAGVPALWAQAASGERAPAAGSVPGGLAGSRARGENTRSLIIFERQNLLSHAFKFVVTLDTICLLAVA